jgi:hypothetical protein
MFEGMDDDDRSSLSSLTDLSEDVSDCELPQVVTDAGPVSRAAAAVQGTPKRALRKSTKALHPKARLLGCGIPNRKSRISKLHKRLMANVNHDLEYWVRQAPVYRIAGVNLDKLQVRPKNAPKDKVRAQEVMELMETWESDGASGIFQDEKGRTLVAYFGRRVETNAKVMTYL